MGNLKDSDLISGAEAFTYLISGRNDVQTKLNDTEKWRDVPTGMSWAAFANPDRKFRLKPQTVKVELELPKPFEPKIGEWYFFVSTENDCGYGTDKFEGLDRDFIQTQFGAYRTANEVDQVVEQLRRIKGSV